MKKIIIWIIIVIVVILGVTLGIIDYNRIKNDKYPLFCIKFQNPYYPEESCYGLGYKMFRKTNISLDQPLSQSDTLEFGLWLYTWETKTNYKEITLNEIIDVRTVKAEMCDNKSKLYHSEENRKIYTYCLDEIIISDDKNSIELNKYLKTNPDIIFDIIDKFTNEPSSSYDDGGTKLYSGNNYNILKCHTISGNNDIYIGNKNMGYSSSFCK